MSDLQVGKIEFDGRYPVSEIALRKLIEKWRTASALSYDDSIYEDVAQAIRDNCSDDLEVLLDTGVLP